MKTIFFFKKILNIIIIALLIFKIFFNFQNYNYLIWILNVNNNKYMISKNIEIEENLENYFIKLKEKPISREDNFECSTVIYSNYGFYYKIKENNTTVTKISNHETITICSGIIFQLW